MVATELAGTHRRYSRGKKLDRLQIQLAPADKARIERLHTVRGTSYSEVAARLIAIGLPQLEAEYAAQLAELDAPSG